MKKKLESELISIAHRVLKLTGKEDLEKMLAEIAKLYQKIATLKFLEQYFKDQKNESLSSEELSLTDLEKAISGSPEIMTKLNEEGKNVQKNHNHDSKSRLKEKEEAFIPDNDFTQFPMFEENKEVEAQQAKEGSLAATNKISLDESIKSTGFQIGLNDRLAFVNHLFDNNNEDYDRVVSQLNTMDSFDEVSDFIKNVIKPDYNNWEGKNDYEKRFMEIVEKKFN